MGKTRLGFDLGSSSMKIALLRDDRVVRLEEIRLPENLVDENGCITLRSEEHTSELQSH